MDLQSPSQRCQLLFAEHGSVTGASWLQYLKRILPRVVNPEEATVPVTDWYAVGLHKALGYSTALDGSEDHLIDSSARHFWERLDMPAVRLRLATEVRRLMDQQVLTEWSDAGALVEPHDDQPGGGLAAHGEGE